jgi:8-hydroxy-5-deazaflavin:NADPH oxidoreductase
VARIAVANGYDVMLSNSRGPETLADLVAELGQSARAGTPEQAASAADIVLIAIPTREIGTLPIDALTGKIVIDSDNYYPDRDGHIAELDNAATTSSERLQKLLPASKVVKTLNHIYAEEIVATATPPGTTDRRALAVFGDDVAAKAAVEKFLDDIGFEPVDGGSLAEGWRLQQGTKGYCVPAAAEQLRETIASTTR